MQRTWPEELEILIQGRTRAGGDDDDVEVALCSASSATGPLRGFLHHSPGQRSQENLWRPVEVGLAVGNRRRRAIGPNHNFWFSSGWILPRCDHGRGVYPCSPGSGGFRLAGGG